LRSKRDAISPNCASYITSVEKPVTSCSIVSMNWGPRDYSISLDGPTIAL
jgi:hypothetical protein